MRSIKLPSAVLVPLLAWGLAGCAVWPFHHHAALAVRPLATGFTAVGGQADDGLYLDAKSAINRRDYATALEVLQAANARTPGDVRVINAFGVVYDKLGRFDLSARYYAQAAELDPHSTIVANNLQYSGFLRAGKTADTTALAQAGPAAEPYETLYGEAVAAISSGDDARALAILNAALSRKSDDIRVLNALGVVHARIGQFNQSEHYYVLAAALDPGSTIVANNRAASRLLRTRWETATHMPPTTLVMAAFQSPARHPLAPQ